eukprot:gene19364-biopygen6978
MAVTELLWAQEDVAEERDRAPVGPGGCCRGACHGRDRAPLAQGDVVGDRVMAVTELLWTPGGCRLSLRLERGRAGLADLLPPPTQPQRKNSTTSTLALDVNKGDFLGDCVLSSLLAAEICSTMVVSAGGTTTPQPPRRGGFEGGGKHMSELATGPHHGSRWREIGKMRRRRRRPRENREMRCRRRRNWQKKREIKEMWRRRRRQRETSNGWKEGWGYMNIYIVTQARCVLSLFGLLYSSPLGTRTRTYTPSVWCGKYVVYVETFHSVGLWLPTTTDVRQRCVTVVVMVFEFVGSEVRPGWVADTGHGTSAAGAGQNRSGVGTNPVQIHHHIH